MMRQSILLTIVLITLFTSGCFFGSDDDKGTSSAPDKRVNLQTPDDSKAKDSLTVAALNQTIGFDVATLLLVDKSDTLKVFHELELLWADYQKSLPQQRIQIQADTLAAMAPDVILLQESMGFYKDGTKDIDFIEDLPPLIEAAGGPNYQVHFVKVNELDLVLTAKTGQALLDGTVLGQDSTLDLQFWEGNAVLVKEGIEVVEESMDEFKSLVKVTFLEGESFSSERNNTWAIIKKDGKKWEVGSTHLEVSGFTSKQSKDQAYELLSATNERYDGSFPQVIGGDLNWNPNTGTHEILTANGDFFDVLEFDENYDPEAADRVNSCCQQLVATTTTAQSLLDYIIARGIVDGSVSYHSLGGVSLGDGTSLWGADHSLVYATLVTQRD